MTPPISTAQLIALRALDERPQPIRANTARALERIGYAKQDSLNYKLTPRGRAFIQDYVDRTGNGPEDLKAMFRF